MRNNYFMAFLLTTSLVTERCSSQAQDSLVLIRKSYIETVLTVGYNKNLGDQIDGKRPKSFHFVEVGFWRTKLILAGHHPISSTYYFANDFGLNTNSLTVGPKIGGFISIMILGVGGEFCYYTDFDSGSLRFIPSIGIFNPYFKLTVNPHISITNKDFQNLNKVHINLTVSLFKIRHVEF